MKKYPLLLATILVAAIVAAVYGVYRISMAYVEAIALRQEGATNRQQQRSDTSRNAWQTIGDLGKGVISSVGALMLA